ncbi:MAG: hypothetical protein M1814_004654 [Vezdaea aestivalis]|nr:MAG: hypothetical protein M1814_004654 [Vezdaea aestivalis]
MPSPHILLLGGHGRVSLLLTPKLLSRSWRVTSLVRDPSQVPAIESLGANHPSSLNVVVRSIDDVKSQSDAQKILDDVKPDWVIWSAGAGGKGGASRTYQIDRDASQYFAAASLATPSIRKYLLVSALISRKTRASWWSDEDWQSVVRARDIAIPDYSQAKISADHYFTAQLKDKYKSDPSFQGIILRPGTLSDDLETHKVSLGRSSAAGSISRGDTAEVAVQLLESEDTRGWYDLLQGDVSIPDAIADCVKNGIDSVEGEPIEA